MKFSSADGGADEFCNSSSDEAHERRNAELDFIQSAYDSKTEAWIEPTEDRTGGDGCDDTNKLPVIIVMRRLTTTTTTTTTTTQHFPLEDSSCNHPSATSISFLLRLELPNGYPIHTSLIVASCTVEKSTTDDPSSYQMIQSQPQPNTPTTTITTEMAAATAALLNVCRTVAQDCIGEEAVFAVFQRAEEWLVQEWPSFQMMIMMTTSTRTTTTTTSTTRKNRNNHYMNVKSSKEHNNNNNNNNTIDEQGLFWGRMLIYSHHIIGQQKRVDMKALAKELDLTGYVKIGWPGLILLEGLDTHCQQFYNTIRRWAWQYLVIRGEMKERIHIIPSRRPTQPRRFDSNRKFPTFLEVDRLSIVADHCRNVGLEHFFLTSIIRKTPPPQPKGRSLLVEPTDEKETTTNYYYYGALIHVDHMNDPKRYRKWLYRSCQASEVCLLVQECCRPRIILVALVGHQEATVSSVLKQWRSTKVDVDSRGQPCLERNMTVLVQGRIDAFDGTLWEETTIDNVNITTTKEKLVQLIESSTQTKSWVQAIQLLMQ